MRPAPRMKTIHRYGGDPAKAAWPWIILFMGFVLLVAVSAQSADASDIPRAAQMHRDTLVRAAHFEIGLDAPVATLAAQIHQESRWRPDAKSPVGARGISQFMPATATWIAKIYPALGPADPFNPGWALRAMVRYDAWHLEKFENHPASPCEKWALALSAYNGGLGWVYRDRDLARASGARGLGWFDDIERFNSGRSISAFNENRHYVRAILLKWEPLYVAAGWGRGVCA